MNKYTILIDQYLNNELSVDDKKQFEKQLETNAELKKEYDLQVNLINGIKRIGAQHQVEKSVKKIKTTKLIFKAVIVVATVAIVLGGSYLIHKMIKQNTRDNLQYELNEIDTKNWSQADINTPSELFEIKPNRDTIIETEQGIIFSIPASAFIDKTNNPVTSTTTLEIKEALTPADIINANLTTLSNDQLLETGGMFYINARVGNDNLKVNSKNPITVSVPDNSGKKDMLLFDGERKKDGSINWINPIKTKKQLTTVNILNLDFYPEHFLDTLKSFGYDIKNKRITDSVYYSLVDNCGREGLYDEADFAIADSISVKDTTISSYSFDTAISTTPLTGEHIFKQNCAVCHALDNRKLTAPGLQNVLQRAPSMNWLKAFIKSNNKLIASNDAYAHKLILDNGGADGMPEYDYLSDKELNALIEYITGQKHFTIENVTPNCSEINPSRIRAIWDKQFNHTLLATKSFEKRLKLIFKTCNPSILALYTNNLDKNIYEIDSIAATMTSGDIKTKFLNFYQMHEGSVNISSTQQLKLETYISNKKQLYDSITKMTLNKIYEEDFKKNNVANKIKDEHQLNEINRLSTNFNEELETNMIEAYRQLGKPYHKTVIPPTTNYITSPIINFGWKNVDRYVMESTVNRTTLNYTDSETGKKAVIKYEPLTIKVTNSERFDKIVAYLIPNKLSSFQLLKNTNSIFTENLNELFNYSVITIGYKNNNVFFNQITSVIPKEYTLELKSISQETLTKTLNNQLAFNKAQDVLKELDFVQFELKEDIRQNSIAKREEIRVRLMRVIYPCMLPATQPH